MSADEHATYLRPSGLPGVEALHASFLRHEYRPHSHPTWTVAVVERGAARFEVDARRERADRGELFVLEPGAVHTGMAAVPEGWAYKVLYLDPAVFGAWSERDGPPPGAARWVVFRDRALRDLLLRAHAALAVDDLEAEVAVLEAVRRLGVHLRPGPEPAPRGRAEHAAVGRARAHLVERWDQPVSLAALSQVAGLSRFELSRRFREQTGLAPHQFQIDLRVARARELLVAGRPAGEVALSCGFSDQPHFTRVFRRAVGVTPVRYARAA